MDSRENDPNRKIVEEVTAALSDAAAERITGETEPAFTYFIETPTAEISGDAK